MLGISVPSSVFAQNFGGGFFGGAIANANIIRNSGGIDLSYGNIAAAAQILGGGYRHYLPGGYYGGFSRGGYYQQQHYHQPYFQGAVTYGRVYARQVIPYGGNFGHPYTSPYGNAYSGTYGSPYGTAYSGSRAPSDMGLPGSYVYQQMGISTAPPTEAEVQARTDAIYRHYGY